MSPRRRPTEPAHAHRLVHEVALPRAPASGRTGAPASPGTSRSRGSSARGTRRRAGSGSRRGRSPRARSAWISSRSAGPTRSSASRASTQSCRAARTAKSRWATKPGQGAFVITRAPARLRDLARAVRRAGVHEHDLVAEGDARDRVADVSLLVLRDQDGRERHHARQYSRAPQRRADPARSRIRGPARYDLRVTDTAAPLTTDALLRVFEEQGALLQGHFLLTSGLHSPRYLQCARVLMDPALATRLCADARAPASSRTSPARAPAPSSPRPSAASSWRTRSPAPSAAAASSPSARTAR